MLILSNNTSSINYPHILLNKSIIMSKQDSTYNTPNFYFEDSLIFNKLESTESSDFLFKIDEDNLSSANKLYFSAANLGIEFDTNFTINLKNSTTIPFLTFDSDTTNTIETQVDFKTNKIITDDINIITTDKDSILNIKKGFDFVGPTNYGVRTTETDISVISQYDITSSDKIIQYKNGIIGKEGYIYNVGSTTVTNMIDPFPEDYKSLDSDSLDVILGNFELMYYLPSNINQSTKIENIKTAFLIELGNLSGLNAYEKYIELVKKYFYIEPKERKFINGCMINNASKTERDLATLEDDIISDLTENTQRITWNYIGNDAKYTEYDDGIIYYDVYNNLIPEESELDNFIFYVQDSKSGILNFINIFDTYLNGIQTEFIFENSCSFEGFLSMRENINNNPKSAHFKFNGFFDRNNQKKTIEIIYQPDTIWNITIDGEYTDNNLKITATHNSPNQILVNCSLKIVII
jgi:hypothetical protein